MFLRKKTKIKSLLDYIKILETQTDSKRYETLLQWLESARITYQIQPYATGRNIIVPTSHTRKIGIASHFDTVHNTPGANDNASAVAVCMELAKRYQKRPFRNFGLEIFFFDEEETGLKGSSAYVQQFGIAGFLGLINMELVGMGNRFALWPVHAEAGGMILEAFEATSSEQGIPCNRMDQIVMNTADHESFREAGLQDCFTLSCISDKDVEVAAHYYKAMEFEVDPQTLYEIFSQAPIFAHYHQPTDKSKHLSEKTLQMTADSIWRSLQKLDKQMDH